MFTNEIVFVNVKFALEFWKTIITISNVCVICPPSALNNVVLYVIVKRMFETVVNGVT